MYRAVSGLDSRTMVGDVTQGVSHTRCEQGCDDVSLTGVSF